VNVESHLRVLQNAQKALLDANTKLSSRIIKLEEEVKSYTSSLQSIEKRSNEYQASADFYKKSSERLSLEVKSLQRKLSRVGNGLPTGDLEKELEALRRRLRCTVCDDREVNACVTRCGHCICRQCADTRIKNRDRKCPRCSLPIDMRDIKEIWI